MAPINPQARADRESLIDRVQKLLAKAESCEELGSKAEAESFRDKAADLMAEFAIDQAEFAVPPTFVVHDVDRDGADPRRYEEIIGNAVAKFNGCLCVVHTSRMWDNDKIKHLKIAGTEGDVAGFLYMYDSVLRQMRTAFISFLETDFHLAGKRPKSRDQEEFYNGFALGLSKQVVDLMRKRDSKIQEWGLVPINEVQKARNFYEAEVGKLRNLTLAQPSFNRAGVNAGESARLNKGLDGHGRQGLPSPTLRLT